MLTLALPLLLATHVGQLQFGRFPFVDDQGLLFGGGTSWGLVLPDDVYGGYGRVCEESFGAVVYFAVPQPTRNRILLGGLQGLATTTDGGCTLQVIENELRGEYVSALHVDPANPDHLFIATSTTSAANGLWESVDGGNTFAQVFAAIPDASFFGIAVSADGSRVALSGNDGTGYNLMLWSEDGGASFSDVSALYRDIIIARVLGFDDDDLLVGGLLPTVRGFVDRGVLHQFGCDLKRGGVPHLLAAVAAQAHEGIGGGERLHLRLVEAGAAGEVLGAAEGFARAGGDQALGCFGFET